jgi:NADP-dependent 3-hydroxy acid dehydrogenase YdfG
VSILRKDQISRLVIGDYLCRLSFSKKRRKDPPRVAIEEIEFGRYHWSINIEKSIILKRFSNRWVALMRETVPRTALITGASAGFGEACARRFAAAGTTKIVLVARRVERLEKLKGELAAPAHVMALDIRNRLDVEEAINSIPPEFAEIDVLINNAGLALEMERAYRGDLDDWDVMIDTNIKGLLYCTRLILEGMVARNRGHVINLGSIAGTYPYVGSNVYGATKAFVKQFSLNLKADLQGTLVRVTNVEPGLAETGFSLVRFKGDVNRAKAVYAGAELIMPEDMAEIIFWVAKLPCHLNVNRIEVMPVCQSFSSFKVDRKSQ